MSKDSGTRSGLLWEVERILKELNETDSLPQVLLMENVPDVIGTKNIKDFNEWYAFLESIGYQSYYKLLNAKNYGVPQNRNRCFMVSIIGNNSYTFPMPIPLEKRLKDVLEAEVDERYCISYEKTRDFYEASRDRDFYEASRDISNYIRTSGRDSLDRHSWDVVQIGNCMPTQTRDNPNQGRIYASEGISPSLNCMEGGNRQPMIIPENTVKGYAEAYPGDGVYINRPHQIRKLTPLECWRLMGFSDEDFRKAEAVNSNTQLYSQAGNSIVKQVLMAIFKKLIAGRSNRAR